MDARLRESFLRELMILQSPPILSAGPTTTSSLHHHHLQQQQLKEEVAPSIGLAQQSSLVTTTEQTLTPHGHQIPIKGLGLEEQQQQQLLKQSGDQGEVNIESTEDSPREARTENLSQLLARGAAASSSYTNSKHSNHRQVDITLSDESGSTGRTLSALFVACDTNLTHLLLNDLKTPIGIQSSALVRLNDVIAIEYR